MVAVKVIQGTRASRSTPSLTHCFSLSPFSSFFMLLLLLLLPPMPHCAVASKPSTTQDIDFEIQMWFNYGATYLPGRPDSKRVELKGPTDFETRIRDYYRPKMKELRQDRAPDLIIYASGTWDLTTLMFDYYHEALEKGVDVQQQAMSWQELAFHRRRLLEMRRYGLRRWMRASVSLDSCACVSTSPVAGCLLVWG